MYSRGLNPTVEILRKKLAALDAAEDCLVFNSGAAAIFAAVLANVKSGDHIVSVQGVYTWARKMLEEILPRFNVTHTYIDGTQIDNFKSAIQPNTTVIYLETPNSWTFELQDLKAVAALAKGKNIVTICDNSYCTPLYQKPIELGIDLSLQSATKYIGGHGTTIGGMIIDSGKFDWVANKDRFPMLNEPDPSYHGVVYTAALGAAAYIGRCRVVPLRNTGAALAPHSAFLLLQGLETLALRMERHCSNAVAVANYLQNHPQIAWVNYAALTNSPHQATCQKITGGHASGILSFGIKGGKEAGAKFIDALQMILRLVNIGDAKSLACHPASTTHRQLSPDELKRAGVSEDMVRISVGIEHIDDIIADIEQALAKAAVL